MKKARAIYCNEYKGMLEFDENSNLTMEERTDMVRENLEKTPTLLEDGIHAPNDYVVKFVEKASSEVYWDEEWQLVS